MARLTQVIGGRQPDRLLVMRAGADIICIAFASLGVTVLEPPRLPRLVHALGFDIHFAAQAFTSPSLLIFFIFVSAC